MAEGGQVSRVERGGWNGGERGGLGAAENGSRDSGVRRDVSDTGACG
jgi:hypothetical protein